MDIDQELKQGRFTQRFDASLPALEEVLDRYARNAAKLLGASAGMVVLTGRETMWPHECKGADWAGLPHDARLGAGAFQAGPAPVASVLLNNADGRFYAGAALRTEDGVCLGTIWVRIDRPWDGGGVSPLATLENLATTLTAEISLHARLAARDRQLAEFAFCQDVNATIARAGDFRDGLTGLLQRWCQDLGADYLLVPQLRRDGATCRFVVGVAAPGASDALEQSLAALLAQGPVSIDQVGCGSLLHATDDQEALVDTGLIDPGTLADGDVLRTLVAAGLQRQLAVPLLLEGRRYAVAIGFSCLPDVDRVVAMLRNMVVSVTPLLQGQMREFALERSRYQLGRANRALRALSACSQAVTQAVSEAALIETICKIVVESGQYRSAWASFAEGGPQRRLRMVAEAGIGADDLHHAIMSWGDDPYGQGPSGVAVRENRPVVLADVVRAPSYAPWRRLAVDYGYDVCVALPLAYQNQSDHQHGAQHGDRPGAVFGTLTICGTAAHGPIEGEELNFLIELASQLAAGIEMRRERAQAALAIMRQQVERDRAEAARRLSERRLTQLLDASPTVIYALEPEPGETDPALFRAVEISSNVERLFGYRVDEALSTGWWTAHIHPADRAAAIECNQRLRQVHSVVHRYRFALPDGTYRWVRDEMTLLRDANGRPKRIVGAWVDITEKQAANEEIDRLAYFDTLTGLANEHRWRQKLANALSSRARASAHDLAAPEDITPQRAAWGVFLLEIEGLAQIGEVWGQAIIDAVEVECARRLKNGLRASDELARLRSGRFGVILFGASGRPGAQAAAYARLREVARQLATQIAAPIPVGERICHVTATIGIAASPKDTSPNDAGPNDASPKDANQVEALIQSADIALSAARRQGEVVRAGGLIAQFSPPMQQEVNARYAVESELRSGLADQRFELWLQSQVDHDGRVVGAEALLRLRTASGALISPADFIPVAEATGLIGRIGALVREQACAILAATPMAVLPRLSVNVSPRELHRPDFVRNLCQQIRDAGVAPGRLVLEITENSLIERPEEIVVTLAALRAFGLNLSIDDFGTGYSSLAYLHRLPIQEVKLDQRFIGDLPDQRRGVGLVEAMLTMARRLGFDIVAEGVETEAQAQFLRLAGCPTLQGYLFDRPTPADAWLARAAQRAPSLPVPPILAAMP
ncbi:MAG: EAL domain-containing protein [Acidiphilium sp.]